MVRRRRRKVKNPDAVSPWPFVGMAGTVSAFFLYAASGVAGVPWWGVIALVLVWVVLFALSCAWWTPHPNRLVGVAVVAVVVWFAAVIGGGAFLDWSA